MRKLLVCFMTSMLVASPISSYAFTDGSGWVQVSYLIKLVEGSIRRYIQLQQIIQSSKESQEFMRAINRGLDDSIHLLSALPIKDEKVLGQLKTFQRSLLEVQNIYGAVPKSPDEKVQRVNDDTVAESLKMVSNASDYAEKQEENATMLESRSWSMSPKGAARMQAQVSSQILHTLNQILKMNAQLLKMQSTMVANQNRDEKRDVTRFQRFSRDVDLTSRSFAGGLDLPKF